MPPKKGQATGPKRNPAQRERDEAMVITLYCKGYTQQAITEAINEVTKKDGYTLSRVSVGKDIERVVDQWKAQTFEEINRYKAEELAKINNLERTYWEAWERSLKDVRSIHVNRTVQRGQPPVPPVPGTFGNPNGLPGTPGAPAINRRSSRVSREQRLGEPEYLRGVAWCISQRCKILGIDAPESSGLPEISKVWINVDIGRVIGNPAGIINGTVSPVALNGGTP